MTEIFYDGHLWHWCVCRRDGIAVAQGTALTRLDAEREAWVARLAMRRRAS